MADIDIKSFRSGFNGQVYEPTDAGYDEARQIWNASVYKHPKVIARCSGVADVISAVNFGQQNNLLTAIRGGGHNVGGRALCDDGLVIDLSRMKSVFVDGATHRVRVQGGATWVTSTERPMCSGLPSPVASCPGQVLAASP
jgi:UDP-N-acetylenolpyruvoylglucosamine reductase